MNKYFLSVLLALLLSCEVSKINDDYLIVNHILEKARQREPKKSIGLEKSNKNHYVISLIKKFRRYELNDTKKLDSLKNFYRIKKWETKEIFNRGEYDYMISQKTNETWNLNKIYSSENKKESKYPRIYKITKPIYTSNGKYALVRIYADTWSMIGIYQKKCGDWEVVRSIVSYLLAPKIHFIEID